MNSTQLGYVKLYWKREVFGKMCKLKDVDNLAITRVEHCGDETVEITIVTPMDNITTNRVKTVDDFNNGFKRYKEEFIETMVNNSSLKKNNNTIDFKGITNKKREENQEKINEFNNVVLNNLEQLRELFFQVELDKSCGYYKLNITPTPSSNNYCEFNYENIESVIIHGTIKEKSEQALSDFVTEILLKYKTDIEKFDIPKFNKKWVFNINELIENRAYINCETQQEFDELCELLKINGIPKYIKSEDFIRYGNRTCVYIYKERDFDNKDKTKHVSYIVGTFHHSENIYKFKNIDFSK